MYKFAIWEFCGALNNITNVKNYSCRAQHGQFTLYYNPACFHWFYVYAVCK